MLRVRSARLPGREGGRPRGLAAGEPPRPRIRWLAPALATCAVVAVCACGPTSSASSPAHPTGPAHPTAPVAASSRASSPRPGDPESGYPGNPGPGWSLTWKDDFTGPAALRDWAFANGGNGWGNKELQTNESRNASLAPGGGLVITATHSGDGQQCWYGSCTYSGARLETQGMFTQKYGLFEARIKLPTGAGLWPAFWMEGVDINRVSWPAPGEIDVIEVNNSKPGLVEAFAHGTDENYGAYYQMRNPLSDGYHVFGIDWTATGITWLVDGHAYGHINAYAGWPFDQPFFLILSLAVGGVWPGSPTSSTRFPAHMDVSWVRVYQQKA